MTETCIASERDRKLLAYNGFNGFESLWNAELDWFEEPNRRRNGWSGVSKCVLKKPGGGFCSVFIKRQQNHNFKSFLHPIRGLPTIHREYKNICRMKAHDVPCPDLVLFGRRKKSGHWQAILITRSLDGYKSLEDCLDSLERDDVEAREALLTSVAETVSRMHGRYLRHSCLYAKHIFVRLKKNEHSNGDGTYDCDSVVIDLEKMRSDFPVFRLATHDLDQLYRHWRRGEGDWEQFIGRYLARMKSRLLRIALRYAVARKATSKLGREMSKRPITKPDPVGQSEPVPCGCECCSSPPNQSCSVEGSCVRHRREEAVGSAVR